MVSSELLFEQSAAIRLGGLLLIGVLGAGLVMVLEKLAIAMFGALLGFSLYQVYTMMMGLPDEVEMIWLMPAVASLAGSMIFPLFFERYLLVTTSLMGALGIGWSTEHLSSDDLPVLALIWGGGCLIQFLFQPEKRESKIK